MSLIDRLAGTELPKISTHYFGSAVHEAIRGKLTRAQIISIFNLVGSDVTELDQLITRFQAITAADRFKYALELEDVFRLKEFGAAGYSSRAEILSKLGV